MLPEEMQNAAFKAANGEFGWTRDQVPGLVAALREQQLAILGGELWWVFDGSRSWNALVPQREGRDAAYAWETKRHPAESWFAFVKRCAADTVATVEKWPASADLPPNLPGQILYNLTWVSEAEHDELGRRAV